MTASRHSEAEAAKAVVRRNTEQVQGQGDFALFDELFADDFVDHTPSPAPHPTKPAFASSTTDCATRFPTSDPRSIGKPSTVTTYKIYHDTHVGDFLGIAPTGRTIQFETVDAIQRGLRFRCGGLRHGDLATQPRREFRCHTGASESGPT